MSGSQNYELEEREICALVQENVGAPFKRLSYIKDRCIEARIEAALIPTDVCPFSNNFGFCKLNSGHKGTHTVIWLGT